MDKRFEVDRQTFSDLEVFSNPGNVKSLFNLFNEVITEKGKLKLTDMFSNPSNDYHFIVQRNELIKFFQLTDLTLGLDNNLSSFADFYLTQRDYPVRNSKSYALGRILWNKMKSVTEKYVIEKGIVSIIKIMNNFHEFYLQIQKSSVPYLVNENNKVMRDIFDKEFFKKILKFHGTLKFSSLEIEDLDYSFRYSDHHSLAVLFDILYEYECFICVAKTSKALNFTFPIFDDNPEKEIELHGLFHPFINNPISNDVFFSQTKNVFFLSGANMAGKSTFLKSFGLSVYLAHLGFPVPARLMKTSVFNGLFTTINLQDNLNVGFSHFYSEVRRVKAVAEKLRSQKNLIVIFDELFRGTNVKDAFDASLLIITAFSMVKNSFFIISTHIVEIADELQSNNNIEYVCFKTEINDNIPVYNYKLEKGVTKERLGMLILNNEKIIEIIQEGLL
jgi:DNA mismatch repair protein MutS